ncbi:MAG: hypothetical protein QY322_03805 [bacterium]|nr:MAG: hypothetical protein QY322_03805 [bacterium]
MIKEITNHLIFWVGFFLLVVLVNKLFSLSYWPFYVGGLIGLFLPYIDHLVHIFIFKPLELTSQRVILLVKSKQYKMALNLLYDTRDERKELIFHTLLFQVIFAVLTFWIVSSSGSFFVKGLVLAYFLNLTIFNLKKVINNEIILEDYDKSRIYFAVQVILLFVFGILI